MQIHMILVKTLYPPLPLGGI